LFIIAGVSYFRVFGEAAEAQGGLPAPWHQLTLLEKVEKVE
jgi:hypothetical protein